MELGLIAAVALAATLLVLAGSKPMADIWEAWRKKRRRKEKKRKRGNLII